MATIVGTGTGVVLSPNGALNIQSTAVGNVGTGTDDLHTFTLPANTLTTTNRGIQWEGSGSLANNANAKTLDILFGASMLSIVVPAGLLSVASNWFGVAKIIRTGSSAQRFAIHVTFTDSANVSTRYVAQSTLSQTETGAIVIKCTGTATSNNDIVQNTSVISYF